MRKQSQRTDSDFPFPGGVYFGPFVSALACCDKVGLVNLWAWAWAHECRVPIAEDPQMASISALGERWPTSTLRAELGNHFAADGVALALWDAWTARLLWRQKSAEGGRRSGESRRKTKGGSRVVPPTPPPPRTTVEPPFNHPSTVVPEIDVNPIGEPYRADLTTPPTTNGGSPDNSPPIPPLRETSFSTSAAQNESLSGGEGGGGGLEPQPTKVQIEKWVTDVLDCYVDAVKPADPPCARAHSNVRSLLVKGTDVEKLLSSCRNYGASMDALQREPRFRKSPANFFSRREKVWVKYLEVRDVLGGVSSLACFAERLRAVCPQAADWFVAWGDRHASRNDFTKPDDPRHVAAWWATFHAMGITEHEAEEASLWMSTRPRVPNRVEQRATLLSRIRAKRDLERAKPFSVPAREEGPAPAKQPPMAPFNETPDAREARFEAKEKARREHAWQYLTTDVARRRMFPAEYDESGVIKPEALRKHGFLPNGTPIAKATVR